MAIIVRGCIGHLWEPILGHVFTVASISQIGETVALGAAKTSTFQMTDGRTLHLFLVPAAFCQKIEGLSAAQAQAPSRELEFS
jgi:hypothetical protein